MITQSITHLLLSGSCKNIVFLTGAGISVAAGIPDFRSPGGMYQTLRPELLTASEHERKMMKQDPTTVVSTTIFYNNQFPYLELRRPFILGVGDRKWKATLAHFFIKVCHDKGLLTRLFTQNIDGLDMQLGIPDDKIVPVHGTMGSVHCEFCHSYMDLANFREQVRTKIKDIYGVDPEAAASSTNILCPTCGKPGVKPSTVLYGGRLPGKFFECSETDTKQADLLVVIGTSLTVQPANQLVTMVPETCRRLVVNNEVVGKNLGLNFNASEEDCRDWMETGACDAVIAQWAKELGWLADLAQYREQMAAASVATLDQIMAT